MSIVHETEEQRWAYNVEDCVRTREIGEVTSAMIDKMGLRDVEVFQQSLFYPVLRAMQLGVRIDEKARNAFALELQDEMSKREAYFQQVLGHPLNPRSPLQMTKLFYEDLQIKPVIAKAKKGVPAHVTCDDKALEVIMLREPITRPLIHAIQEYRSLGVFLSTFVLAKLDYDKRMRCSYNICGTETYRFSSSKNPFESGTNLQNIPKGNEEAGDALNLPNVRKLFVPDAGFTFFDMDLDRADLQVVVWEADDPELKAALRLGVDMHLLNAYTLAGKSTPPLEELVETHANYQNYRIPFKKERQLAKSFIHGCVTAGHEILTPNGWVDVADYQDGTPIMAWKDGQLFWETPSYFHRDQAVDLCTLSGESWAQEMTWDHRVVYETDSSGWKVTQAATLPNSARLPKSGMFEQEADEYINYARQVAAFQADGTTDSSGATVFHVAKGRKLGRLQELFPEAQFSEWADGTFGCRISKGIDPAYKYAGPWILKWSSSMLDAWLDELPHWDGTFGKTGRVEIMGTDKKHIEWVATVAHLRGKGASVGVKRNRPEGRKDLWYVGLNNRPKARVSSMTRNSRILATPVSVYCPTVSSGFFMFRKNMKIGITGNTNYGGGARTMAAAAGVTVHQADKFQQIYFGRYPGLKAWHERTLDQLTKHRFVQNAFGYRRYYFDRTDGLLPEALAWIPQSTVANVIDRIWVNLFKNVPEVSVLLQVHDSLAGQFPTQHTERLLSLMKDNAHIIVPYEDNLIIPIGIKTSTKSWGDCQ